MSVIMDEMCNTYGDAYEILVEDQSEEITWQT